MGVVALKHCGSWVVCQGSGGGGRLSAIPVCPQVLHCCVCGSSTYTQQSHYTLTLADLSSTDYDPFLPLANVRNSEPVQYHSSADLGNLLTVEDGAYVYKYTILWAVRDKIVVWSVLVFRFFFFKSTC